MLGTTILQNQAAALLGADTTTLAEATPFVAVSLIKEPFTPSRTLTWADVVEADFDGYAELHAASAATQVFTDPATSDNVMQARDPAGGWHWVTTGLTNLPQTIYGYVLTDSAQTDVYASALFDVPVVLNAVGQAVDVGQVNVRIPVGSLV